MFFVKILNSRKRLSIQTRLTILFVAIFGATLIFFATVAYQMLYQALKKEFDDALFNYAIDISESVTLQPTGDLQFQTPALDKFKIYPFSMGDAHIQIRSLNGEVLAEAGDTEKIDIPYKKDFEKIRRGEEPTFRTFQHINAETNTKESYRLVSQSVDNEHTLLLQIAVPLTLLEDQIKTRRRIFLIIIPTALIIATIAGYILSRRALRPVQEIIQKAQLISASELSQRLPVPDAKDEIQGLAQTLNEMLGRIEGAFRSQERFIADASHQLLTPLSIMRGELETNLKKAPAQEQVFITSLLQEVDHLTSIIRDLLTLARVEAGKEALSMAKLHFDDIILETISRTEKLAKQKNIQLKFHIENLTSEPDFHPTIIGESDLLSTMVYNIIENAIKYSPPNETVLIRLAWEKERQILSVEDQGQGIPLDQQKQIFERFYRAPGTKTKGHGLGLAIAQKIAQAHSGRLWVSTEGLQRGSRFYFEISNLS